MSEPPRCETHRVVLTSAGACLLCARRAEQQASSSALRKLGSVAGALVLVAAGYRACGMLTEQRAERAQKAVAEKAVAEKAALAAPAAVAGGTAPAAVAGGTAPGVSTVDAQRAVRIEVYGEGWCPSCRKARAWLDAQGIAYTYRDTSEPGNKRAMRALNPQSTIPTIDIDGRILVGFSAPSMQQAIQNAARARSER